MFGMPNTVVRSAGLPPIASAEPTARVARLRRLAQFAGGLVGGLLVLIGALTSIMSLGRGTDPAAPLATLTVGLVVLAAGVLAARLRRRGPSRPS